MPSGSETVARPNLAALRQLPLKAHLRQGRFGAEHAAGPGVQLSLRHPLSIATVIARMDKGKPLAEKMQELCGVPLPKTGQWTAGLHWAVQWCGSDQYFVVAEGLAEGELYRELRTALDGLASVSDQSHGRVVMRVVGPKAANLLSKGSPVDFHPRAFPDNGCAMTQMAHIGVHVSRISGEGFELSLFRAFSEHFWEWLTEQAQEFGYEVL